jgi:hypothetical protein
MQSSLNLKYIYKIYCVSFHNKIYNIKDILFFYKINKICLFSLCKSVDSDGIYTWQSFIGNIFKELDLEITDFENFSRPFASIKHSLKKKIKKVINV